MLIFVVLKVL